MTAQQFLAKSGITLTGESVQADTNKFLDQFDKPAPAPEEKPKGQVTGHVIRRISDKKVVYFQGKHLHDTNWDAAAVLHQHVSDENRRKDYEIVPVRVDG